MKTIVCLIPVVFIQVCSLCSLASTGLDHLPVMCIENMGISEKDAESARQILSKGPTGTEAYINAWSAIDGKMTFQRSIQATYDAANLYSIPPQVLAGAFMEESSYSNLGIVEDFGNWSCGIGQINIVEWCSWVQQLPMEKRKALGWPTDQIALLKSENPLREYCAEDFIALETVKPFFSRGLDQITKGGPRAPYMVLDTWHSHELESFVQLGYEHFMVPFSSVENEIGEITRKHSLTPGQDQIIPVASDLRDGNTLLSDGVRYKIAMSFINNCNKIENGVTAKAFVLKSIYDQFIPREAKVAQKFQDSSKNPLICQQTVLSKSYPLNVGWLIADAIYNAGEEILPGILEYRENRKLSWEEFGPTELSAAIQWALDNRSNQITPIGITEARYHTNNIVSNVTREGFSILPHAGSP